MAKSESSKTPYEQFVEAYLAKTKAEAGEGYANWLNNNGSGAKETYANALRAAEIAYESSLGGYGVQGERTGRAGIGGYSAYLDDRARAARRDAKETASAAYEASRTADRRGYAAYLENKHARTMQIIKNLTNKGIGDYQTAYDYALAVGADPNLAGVIASVAGEWEGQTDGLTNSNLRLSILKRVVDLNLPEDASYRYALACGLDEESAREIAAAATQAIQNQNTFWEGITFPNP